MMSSDTHPPQSWLKLLRNALDDEQPIGRWMARAIQGLILLSMLLLGVSTLPRLDPDTLQTIEVVERLVIAVFTLEYVLRVVVAKPRRKYVLSFMGLVDLLAILPFYVAGLYDLASLRSIRLLQLLRVLKFARFGHAGDRIVRAFTIVFDELVVFFFIAMILLYVSSCGIYYFEHEAQPEAFASIFHSFWWAVATLTTVGYGDIYPITVGGKVFTFFVLVTGVGFLAVPSGLISSALTQARVEAEMAVMPTDLHALLARALRHPKAVRSLVARTRHRHLPFDDPRDNLILDAVLGLAAAHHSVDIVAVLDVLEHRGQLVEGHLDHAYLIEFIRRYSPRQIPQHEYQP